MPSEPDDESVPVGELFQSAKDTAEAACAESNEHRNNLLVLGISAELLLALVMQRVGSDRIQEYRADLLKVLESCAQDELLEWLESAHRMLPRELEVTELAEAVLMSAITRSGSIRETAIALTAASTKLAEVVIRSSDATLESYKQDIADDVLDVVSRMNAVQVIHVGRSKDAN
jgi:hypothetical protein